MNCKELKDLIYPVIQSHLGTYKISNRTVPAIWVGKPPANITKNGVEILIPLNPESVRQRGNVLMQEWVITMVENPGSAGNFEVCFNLIKRIYPCQAKYLEFQSNLPNALNFAEFTFFDSEL